MASKPIAHRFVRYVRQGVRHVVRHETRANGGMCGMCGMPRTRAQARACVELTITTVSHRYHAHVDECRTYRTYRTTRVTTRLSSVRHVFIYTAHPAQKEIDEVSRWKRALPCRR